jgi:hypothetical protein
MYLDWWNIIKIFPTFAILCLDDGIAKICKKFKSFFKGRPWQRKILLQKGPWVCLSFLVGKGGVISEGTFYLVF